MDMPYLRRERWEAPTMKGVCSPCVLATGATQLGLFDEPVLSAPGQNAITANPRPALEGRAKLYTEPAGNAGNNRAAFSKGDPVTHGGRELRFHRASVTSPDRVWLAALDAGIAGPFYWVRRDELATDADGRAERIKAAQARLSEVAKAEGQGEAYDAALADLHRAMRGAR